MRIIYIAKRQFIFFLLPAMLLLGTLYAHNDVTHKLSDKVIIVDAGHGGIDPGANRPGVLEKEINLAVALMLKDILNQSGAKVVLSRQTDIDLSTECDNEKVRGRYHRDLTARVEMAEESDADLFISIHANAVANAQRRGAEVFYYAKSEPSKVLSNSIQTELGKITPAASAASTADYFVLRRNKIPAALVEIGYITNKEECALLQSPEYQQKLAAAIAKGIDNYY
ncbi:MAG TPA: N-acetylmuramoyl-L-alanine amidase [Methylomusa anaerophila]|uniref:Germination-specific N-acetylmuramoyl-L-alanine amidase n=1 Tax=Methylomusa anaerophila TaxID=1930071 RepID=A0A348AQX5_9FIRM|nr:N-acetylmuramoyl-L-alanine amidase [Methylomusa anaerophila]BBB93473.1 germination-specific N-acetylmuramoyl-L-alanine amidase precursor [Methylomusa anaerophila]HML90591.1 N-acetylmuramoyl-L-alanine amidase [Methylomusa anaerophila]